MVLCFFDDGPHEKDTRGSRPNMFKTGMKDAPCADPLVCCAGGLCIPCANCYFRHKVLEGNMDAYICCQGYYDRSCFKAGSVGDQGNPCCLALEACCCTSCALSATRMYVMDKYDLQSDPCDRRILRFNNFMQMLSCVCHLLACIYPELREAAQIIDLIADLVFACTAGCMFAQVNVELAHRASGGGSTPAIAAAAAPAYAAKPPAAVAYAQPPPGNYAAQAPPAYGAQKGQWQAPPPAYGAPPQQETMGR